jgi:hypothetical protein
MAAFSYLYSCVFLKGPLQKGTIKKRAAEASMGKSEYRNLLWQIVCVMPFLRTACLTIKLKYGRGKK